MIIGIAILVVLFSLIGTGVLAEPWTEFGMVVQELGWAKNDIEFPVSNPSLDVRLTTQPGTNTNFITGCVFHSDEDIPVGVGLSTGTAICKLLDEQGRAIAEGRIFFDSYTGSDNLEVRIQDTAFLNANINSNVFDIKFIIEGPI